MCNWPASWKPTRTLIARYSQRFNLASNLFYPSLEALFAQTHVQAVATFTSTFDHERVVETCAAHGVDVMMEKPLAMNLEHARAMAAAAKQERHPGHRQLRNELVSRQSGGLRHGP